VVAQLLEALRYNSEGHGFDGVIGIFHCLISPGWRMALRSIQPLTEMITKDISQETKPDGA